MQQKQTTTNENDLDSQIYSFNDFPLISFIIFVVLFFTFGFILNYPLKQLIELTIRKNISHIPQCPNFSFKDVSFEYLMPKVIIERPVIPANCIGGNEGTVNLDFLTVYLRRPTFSPLGFKTKIDILMLGDIFSIFLLVSKTEQEITITDQTIDFKHLAPLIKLNSMVPDMNGSFTINTLLNFKNNKIDSGKFKFNSQNFLISPLNHPFFKLPVIKIKRIVIQGEINKNTINLDPLILGSQDSPIRLMLKGTLTYVPSNPENSQLKLNGEIGVDEEFKTLVPLIKTFIQTSVESPLQKITITGPLARPQIKTL